MDPDPEQTTVVVRTRAYAVDTRKVQQLTHLCLARLGIPGRELSVSFVGAAGIRALNRDFRGKDKATDVLSFPQSEFAKPLQPRAERAAKRPRAGAIPEPLGDIVISLPNAAVNAKGIGQALDREVGFLIVHGILHLCGHDHEVPAEERVMLAAQRKLMAALESPRKPPLWRGLARLRRKGGRA